MALGKAGDVSRSWTSFVSGWALSLAFAKRLGPQLQAGGKEATSWAVPLVAWEGSSGEDKWRRGVVVP